MIEIRLLGHQSVKAADGSELLSVSAQPKRLALLAYLILSSADADGFVSRDQVLSFFWPESDQDHARNTLNQHIFGLRGSLGSEAILSHGVNRLGINHEQVWCDAVEFHRAIKAKEWKGALDLHQGEFLGGFYLSAVPELEKWLDSCRLRIQRQALEAALALAREEESAASWPEAANWYRRATEIAPESESAMKGLRLAIAGAENATASTAETGGIGPPGPSDPGKPSRVRAAQNRNRWPIVLTVFATIGALVSGAWWLGQRTTASDSLPPSEVLFAPVDPYDNARPSLAVLPFVNMSRSIAVLPFENISGREEDSYFVDGVHADVIFRVAKIEGITPISRASVLGYREAPKSPKEVAQELGVAVVLEGSVQRTGDRLRFNVQLTDRTGRVGWAESYNRELTTEDLFEIQSDIAQQVAHGLGVELSRAELHRIDRIPTGNLEAWDYWVRGYKQFNEVFNSAAAIELLKRAVALDPEFAAAHSTLGAAYTALFWETGQTEKQHCDTAKGELDTARRLDPELADVYVDTGWYYYRCFRDYDRALSALSEALKLAPSSVEALEVVGLAQRRQGNIEEAVATHLRALELSPRYADLHFHLAESYPLLRMPPEAEYHAERAIMLSPTNTAFYLNAANVYLRLFGSPEKAREVLERGRTVGAENLDMVAWDIRLDLIQNRPDSALARASRIPSDNANRFQFMAAAHRLRGDREKEVAFLDSARVLLEDRLEESDSPPLHSRLGLVYANLGRKEDAIREGAEAVRLRPLEKDAHNGANRLEDLAQIYMITGEHEEAIELLERLMSIPSSLTPAYLEIDPAWNPVRENRRFQAMLAGAG